MKYYAVVWKETKELFTSWEECKMYIDGKKGFSMKSFLSRAEAEKFLEQKKEPINFTIPTAYIDGSYDVKTKRYSFGGILIIGDKLYKFSNAYEADGYASARNVAGEIKGAGFIIQHAINQGIKELAIFYDYEGIEKWYTGVWKANSPIAKVYVDFREKVKNKIQIHFIKVKSHSHDMYNDMADQLAKSALGI
ncbi:MAG: ribonuclease H family protein [Anaeroplasmataceae bacterium]|nr:ribonuclease H family protein [Anaeroplasmataceae bacterium]